MRTYQEETTEDEDIYPEEIVKLKLENEEIRAEEEGFMVGCFAAS